MFILRILQERRRKRSKSKWDAQNFDAIWREINIDGRKKKLGDKSQDDQVEHLRSYTTSFKEANWKKMIKRKMSNKNQTNDVSVVCKGRSYLVYNQN
jgi:DnaJ-domain-containing protein 1